jgi:hypothetical protein
VDTDGRKNNGPAASLLHCSDQHAFDTDARFSHHRRASLVQTVTKARFGLISTASKQDVLQLRNNARASCGVEVIPDQVADGVLAVVKSGRRSATRQSVLAVVVL